MSIVEGAARVAVVDVENDRAYLELRNGGYVPVPLGEPNPEENLSVGQVVMVDEQGSIMEIDVDRSLWSRDVLVGTVKYTDDERTLLEVNGSLRRVAPGGEAVFEVGDTVEADNLWGVTAVVTKSRISLLDDYLPSDEDKKRSYLYKPPEDEKESFESFGGYSDVVSRAKQLIGVPLRAADKLREIGARPLKGVLLTGDPGTGKTKLARIIAHQAGAAFLAIDGPEVFSKWIGASEEAIREIFLEAEEYDRAIVFFDEIDSLAARRQSDSHESGRRVLAQLLTRMDGLRPGSGVVVVATTNRSIDIDPALLRAGRFDWIIEFPEPSQEDRLDILRKSGSAVAVEPGMPLEMAARETSGWAPAELTQIWTEAAYFAAGEERNKINEEDFIRALRRTSANRSGRLR